MEDLNCRISQLNHTPNKNMSEESYQLGPQLNKYHVTISFEMDDEFMTLVPPHRTYINFLINKGTIDHYAVSLEAQKSWIVFNAADKEEVETLLKRSPLYRYWSYQIEELFVFDGQGYRMPAVQLN